MLKRNAQFVETVFLKWHLVIYHVGGSQNRSCNKKLLKTYPPLPPRSFCLSGSRPSAISRASFGFSGNLELRTTVLYDLCFNACHVSPRISFDKPQSRNFIQAGRQYHYRIFGGVLHPYCSSRSCALGQFCSRSQCYPEISKQGSRSQHCLTALWKESSEINSLLTILVILPLE
uniref:Uncharacterized protein n=1 Tax=Physcomitrium patens TaxID=3218 RepID=A0A2K1KM06_PHYPA|nr:hypothetical protein PHYPA_005706 [Physcomitrium patens]